LDKIQSEYTDLTPKEIVEKLKQKKKKEMKDIANEE